MFRFHGICHKNCALKYVGWILMPRKLHFRVQKDQFGVKKASFRGLIPKIGHYWPIFGYKNPPMTHFHGICHGNCNLRYVGGVLVLRKLYFGGLKGHIGVKRANFRGLIAKIGHYRPILTTRAHFHVVCHGNHALRYVGGVLEYRKLDLRGLKGQFDVKRANLGVKKLKSVIWGLFWLLEPITDPFK